nr:hypothetical protein [Tanacetum cinerariifolium]
MYVVPTGRVVVPIDRVAVPTGRRENVNCYNHLPELTKKLTPTAEQEYEKSPSDILKIKKEQAEKQKKPKFTIKSTDKAALKEYDLKSTLYQSMHANKSFNKKLGVVDTIKDHKRTRDDDEDDDDEDPPAGPNQGKKTTRRRTKESESPKNPSTTKETPKGDHYPFDLSKPLPLQGPSGYGTVAANYFFNNDLEYLNTSDPEVTYTTSITKTKATQYEIKGIEDMVPTLWSTIKHAYDKDDEKGIKH